jgi:Tol biopolymer transport system component
LTKRATISDPWGTPVRVELNSPGGGWSPNISANYLSLYFASNRTGTSGVLDLWMYTRAAVSDSWVLPPVNLGPTVNNSSEEIGPSISTNELVLFFSSDQSGGEGGKDIWVTTRATVSDPWGTAVNLGSTVNTSSSDEFPSISSDGLILYFGSDRPGGEGGYDIWQVAVNPTAIDEFDGELPTTFSLLQNYPNPFNPSTLIKYSVPENSFVKLSVYNLIGEEVSVLVNKEVDAGFYEVEFNAANLPSGTYFYRLPECFNKHM